MTIRKLILRTLLWLPLCLTAWYFSAHYLTVVAGELAHLLLNGLKPGVVSALEQSGGDLAFVTTLVVHPEPGRTAILVPEVNPLIYTYGLAFFLALMLAANTQWWKIFLGSVALLPFQSWGIAFDFLAQVGIKLGPDIAEQADIFGWQMEVIALSYQIGALIFPSLIPVVLWVSFNRSLIENMLRSPPINTTTST